MKKATFNRNQAEKFNKFLAKYEKARTRKGFNNADMMFCKYKDGYLFGDNTHFEYAEISDIADHFKQYENNGYISCLEYWEKNYNYSAAELSYIQPDEKHKIAVLSNVYGHTFINAKFLPKLPDNAVIKNCTNNVERYPIKVEIDGKDVAWILPIYNPMFAKYL